MKLFILIPVNGEAFTSHLLCKSMPVAAQSTASSDRSSTFLTH